MTLEVSKSFEHNICKQKNRKYSEEDLQKIMLRLMRETGIPSNKFNMTREGGFELSGMPNLKLHTLLLEAEKLGLSIKYTKKTLIEIL